MEEFVQEIFQSLLNLGLEKQQAQQVMQSMQQEHVQYLQQVYQQNPKDKKALVEATAQVIQAMQKALHGAKLNYIKRLNDRTNFLAKGGSCKRKIKKCDGGSWLSQTYDQGAAELVNNFERSKKDLPLRSIHRSYKTLKEKLDNDSTNQSTDSISEQYLQYEPKLQKLQEVRNRNLIDQMINLGLYK